MNKQVLGRGLGALISASSRRRELHLLELPIEQINPNPYQPRKHFNSEKLDDLVQSIREHGVIQPILVTKIPEGGYQIVVGERRWRAAKEAGIQQMPVIIKDLTPQDRVAVALVENLQRDDLNALEEAQAFHFLVEGFGLTQENLGKRIGRSRPYITNTLRLLNLPEAVKSLVVEGKISSGHARALLSLSDPKHATEVARHIASHQLSVRQTENLVKTRGETPRKSSQRGTLHLEKQWRHILGTRVKIHMNRAGGKIEIYYQDLKHLEKLTNQITRSPSKGKKR